jgi:hypothetical protein
MTRMASTDGKADRSVHTGLGATGGGTTSYTEARRTLGGICFGPHVLLELGLLYEWKETPVPFSLERLQLAAAREEGLFYIPGTIPIERLVFLSGFPIAKTKMFQGSYSLEAFGQDFFRTKSENDVWVLASNRLVRETVKCNTLETAHYFVRSTWGNKSRGTTSKGRNASSLAQFTTDLVPKWHPDIENLNNGDASAGVLSTNLFSKFLLNKLPTAREALWTTIIRAAATGKFRLSDLLTRTSTPASNGIGHVCIGTHREERTIEITTVSPAYRGKNLGVCEYFRSSNLRV